MLRRQLAALLVATTTGLILLCAFGSGFAGLQEKVKKQPAPDEKAERGDVLIMQDSGPEAAKRRLEIDKMIAAYDLKPRSSPAIPDDPPPHEGAMITLEHVIEPGDLVMIEVLDALPARPISGERLVRPDGKMSIGFYGEVSAKGLTLAQLKVAIIKHLRTILIDSALGLEVPVDDGQPIGPREPSMGPFQPGDKPKTEVKPRSSSRQPGLRSGNRVVLSVPPQPPELEVQSAKPVERAAQNAPKVERPPNVDPLEMIVSDGLSWAVVPPSNSQMVFVDVTAYNSKNYYVVGDVLITGKLPFTGHETVLDALQYAGGLVPTADPKDIRLVRPGAGGKPTRVYKVDLEAIQEKGDITKNYQIFPGDRLIVGRNEVVKKTVEIDRLNAPIQSIVSYMQQEGAMLRTLQFATAENRDQLLKEMVDFWAKELARPGGVKFDEQTLREAFLRRMKLTPAPLSTTPAPR